MDNLPFAEPTVNRQSAGLVFTLRQRRDIYLQAYHRALSRVLAHSLNHPHAEYWADACLLYERRYQEIERHIGDIESAPARSERAA